MAESNGGNKGLGKPPEQMSTETRLLLAFLSLHAFGTEFLQQFVPERGPSLVDVGIDHVGLAIGLAASWRWWRRP